MKVSLFGDSIIQSCDGNFSWYYGTRGISIVDRFYYGGTAACDWFDDAQVMKGDLAVVCFTGNMLTPCTQGRGTQLEVFAHDLDQLAQIFKFMNKPVLWIAGPGNTNELEWQNWRGAISYDVARRYGQRFDNSSRVLTAAALDGTPYYQKWLPCQPEDNTQGWCWMGVVNIRNDDGYHLSGSGQRRFAQQIVNVT